jgi:hypothetical protein
MVRPFKRLIELAFVRGSADASTIPESEMPNHSQFWPAVWCALNEG